MNLIKLAGGKARICHYSPSVDLAGGQHERRRGDAVLAHDHDAIAGTNSQCDKPGRDGVDRRREIFIAPGDPVLDKGRMQRIGCGWRFVNRVQTRRQAAQQIRARPFVGIGECIAGRVRQTRQIRHSCPPRFTKLRCRCQRCDLTLVTSRLAPRFPLRPRPSGPSQKTARCPPESWGCRMLRDRRPPEYFAIGDP